jgi:glycosyltransferase involved in cell wall biosynthesis
LPQRLPVRGHDVDVFTRAGPDQEKFCCIDDVHYHRCAFEGDSDFIGYVGRMCEAFVGRLREAERFYGRRFEVIHGHDWLAAQALMKLRAEDHRPTVLTMHSTEYGRCGNTLHGGLSARIREVEGRGAAEAERLICVPKALRVELRTLYQIAPERATVIYNGIDVRRFDVAMDPAEARARCGMEEDEPMVLFVGRLAWQKGPDLLLDAVPDVLHGCPDTKFVFAGDGEMRCALEGQAAAGGMFRSVRFLGYREGPELVGLFKTADVLCVPSRNEPFGIVVLEGWSASRPVVVTASGGPKEFVRDRETGYVVSADRDSLTWGVGSALADREGSARIGVSGRREAEQRFSWDQIATQTARVYTGEPALN